MSPGRAGASGHHVVDEQALATQDGPLQDRAETRARLGLDLDRLVHAHHRAGLGAEPLVRVEGDHRQRIGRPVADLVLHRSLPPGRTAAEAAAWIMPGFPSSPDYFQIIVSDAGPPA
jgi:hypothetical protein